MKFNFVRKAKDIIEGIHSGIPLCCIASYVGGRDGLMESRCELGKKVPSDVEYVPCLNCLRNKTFIDIRKNGRLFK